MNTLYFALCLAALCIEPENIVVAFVYYSFVVMNLLFASWLINRATSKNK